MRITLSLDDDVAALLLQIQKKREVPLKQVVNEVLREGLERMSQPVAVKEPFSTRPVDLGKCHFSSLDNTWAVLAEAEGDAYK